jgi:4-hydroxybenzoate polyprenyltransferase
MTLITRRRIMGIWIPDAQHFTSEAAPEQLALGLVSASLLRSSGMVNNPTG